MDDLVGQKFGRLIVLKKKDKNKSGNYRWLCKCDCGKEKIIRGDNLKSGTTKSCGCLQKEKRMKHGHHARDKTSKTYHSWQSMIQRCTNPKVHNYHNYGGRGITVCKRWLEFKNFLTDMGESPGKGYQIDRINNNKGYKKSNCRWVTPKEQARNRRNNHLETYNGKTQLLIEWSEETGIPYRTLLSRLNRGWSIEKALTTPMGKQDKKRKK